MIGVLELTNKCNLSCKVCSRCKGVNELPLRLVNKLLRENILLNNLIDHFELGWDSGNPLLHKDIHEILDQIIDSGCTINILTNAMGLKDFLKSRSLKSIKFTLFFDSHKKEVNDRLMGEGVYDSTVECLNFFKDNGINFNVYMRMTNQNYNHLSGMYKLIKSYGGWLVPIDPFPLSETAKDLIMDDDMKNSVIEGISNFGLMKSIHFCEAKLGITCSYHRKGRIFVNSNGELAFCHFLSSLKDSSIVNISYNSLSELQEINNKVMDGFLKNKEIFFPSWNPKRKTVSPCSYCLHAFKVDVDW